MLIEYTAVLWVPLVAMVFFKEPVKKQIWFGAVLVLGGLAVVAQIWDSTLNPIGVLFALAAATCIHVSALSQGFGFASIVTGDIHSQLRPLIVAKP